MCFYGPFSERWVACYFIINQVCRRKYFMRFDHFVEHEHLRTTPLYNLEFGLLHRFGLNILFLFYSLFLKTADHKVHRSAFNACSGFERSWVSMLCQQTSQSTHPILCITYNPILAFAVDCSVF